ncbi:hypothetical protein, partial [Rhodococcus ruber]|uniref:hypothetical protein n=1 Tax=Rhodococcus ruber TaxID=1830 RepID=UPI001F3BCBD2
MATEIVNTLPQRDFHDPMPGRQEIGAAALPRQITSGLALDTGHHHVGDLTPVQQSGQGRTSRVSVSTRSPGG